MKNIIFTLSICLFLGSLSAQKTMRRYRHLSADEQNDTMITITVASSGISLAKEPAQSKTIFDLTDRGQSSILIGRTEKEVAALLNEKFLEEEKEKSDAVDLCNRNIRVILSINRKTVFTKKGFSAYDRIEDLYYAFTLDPTISTDVEEDQKVKFLKWNKYTTEYGTLNIGTLEYNQSFSANLDVTGKAAASSSRATKEEQDNKTIETSSSLGPEISADGSVGYANSTKENQSIKQQYIQLTGSFQENQFHIHQQGTRETELAGNVSIDLTVRLPQIEEDIFSFKGLYGKSGLPNPTDTAKMIITHYYLPDVNALPNGLCGDLNYTYAIRHIRKNARSFPEFDDRIHFINGRNHSSGVVLIKKKELSVPLYYITVTPNKGTKWSMCYTDTLVNTVPYTINFISYEEAMEFKRWLIYQIQNLGSKTDVFIAGRKITFEGQSVSTQKNNLTNIHVGLR